MTTTCTFRGRYATGPARGRIPAPQGGFSPFHRVVAGAVWSVLTAGAVLILVAAVIQLVLAYT